MHPSLSQKRMWFARESIMDSLRAVGMPVSLDGDVALVRGVDTEVRWLLAASDDWMAEALFGRNASDAVRAIRNQLPALSVRHFMPPGVSFIDGGAKFDGAAMVAHCPPGLSAAYMLPVSRHRTYDGGEWTEMVAVVPRSELPWWRGLTEMCASAQRMVLGSSAVMRVFNGPDVKVRPVSLGDVILDESVKQNFVQDMTGFLGRREWFHERGLAWKRSYLLDGPPGTGKTTLARWAATQLGLPSMSFDFTDRFADGRDLQMCVHECSRMAPCLLILDDVDKVLAGDNPTMVTRQAFLTCLSGMGSLDGVVVVATSNSTEPFQGPMMRRFDRVVSVPLPDEHRRREYLTRMLASDPITPHAIAALAREADGWSFDDLRNAVTGGANAAMARGAFNIEDADLLAASRTSRR